MMLAEDANMQKQKKREEQLRNWREREQMTSSSNTVGENLIIDPYDRKMSLTGKQQQQQQSQREIRVKFPKGCVFLAACSSGDIDEVRQYLKMGVNINTTNIDGLTALHQACIDANLDMVKFLIENQADIDVQDNEGWTPLHAAVSVGNIDVVKYLIGQNARLDVCNNDSDLPVDLVDMSNPQMREMKEYVEEEMRSQSIDRVYEKQKEELTMWEDAQKIDFKERVHAKTGATPLHVAAAKGYLRVIEVLIQRGVDVNAIDHDGWTPLHAAAHWEQEEACRILIQHGADCEAKTFSGQTAFDVCDKEMANKLRILQIIPNNEKEKLTDVTSMNNQFNGGSSKLVVDPSLSSRIRRTSDELLPNNNNNKTPSSLSSSTTTSSTITRMPNEAKSSIGDREKKQDKILLSPITSKTFDVFNTSDSENVSLVASSSDKKNGESHDDFTFDKENKNTTPAIVNNSNMSLQQQQSENDKLASFKSSLNRGKSGGLQESLKSLSAQVRLKIDEEEKNDNKQQISSESDNTKMNVDSGGNMVSPSPPTGGSTTSSNSLLSIGNNPSTVTSTTNTTTRPYLEKRWGNTPGQNENPTYKRKASNPTTTTTSDNQQTTTATTVTAVNPIINQLINNVTGGNAGESSTRRYSSAPIASKDEQAELIRKQKAKLERHFRRSTQAVSYEDIKSAEASIKNSLPGGGGSQNVVSSPSPLDQQSTTSGDPTSSTVTSPTTLTLSFSNYNSTTGTTAPGANISSPTSTAVNPTPAPLQGVSSLSSLFAEKISKANSSTSPSSSLYSAVATNNNTTSPVSSNSVASSSSSSFIIGGGGGNSDQLVKNEAAATTTPAGVVTTTSTTNNDKDNAMIANDIETDKLLNAIEKSKGFSDQLSTTAARRLRNNNNNKGGQQQQQHQLANFPAYIRNNNNNDHHRFQSSSQTSSGEDNSLTSSTTTNNNKKRTKLVWNENRLEVYKLGGVEQHDEQQTTNVTDATNDDDDDDDDEDEESSSDASNGTQRRRRRAVNKIGLDSIDGQPILEENGCSGETVSNNNNMTTFTSSLPNRQLYRFDTGGSGGNNNTNLHGNASVAGRSTIKRSISQVPATTATTNSTSNLDNRLLRQNGNHDLLTTSSSFQDSNKIFDYQAAYEAMRKENDQLKQSLMSIQKELEDKNARLQAAEASLDKRERRTYERRISELESELEKAENLRSDNHRLKEENAALIRVISKLSK